MSFAFFLTLPERRGVEGCVDATVLLLCNKDTVRGVTLIVDFFLLAEAEEHGYACPLPAPTFVGANLFTQKSNHFAGTTVTQLFGLSTSPIDTHEKRLNKQSSRKPQGNR